MTQQKAVNWALFVLLALMWGSSFILIKKGTIQLTGWQIGALRIFSAAVVFLPFALLHIRQLPRQSIALVLLTGFIGNLFPSFLFALAIEQKVPTSMAGILNSLTPLFVIVIGVLFFKTKVPLKKIAGVLLGFVGLLMLSLLKGPVSIRETGFLLLILLATALYGLNVNLVSIYLKQLNPIKIAIVSVGFLAIPSTAVLLISPPNLSSPGVVESCIAVVGLGLMSTAAATVIFYALIKRAGGLFASLVTYAIPIVSIAWGLVYGEEVGIVQLVCLGIILGGVYLANKNPQPPEGGLGRS